MVNRPKKNTDGAANIRPDRKRCAHCGKDEAHAYCTLCHHYFHNNPRFLPAGEEKLVAFNTGKRDRNGEPIMGPMIANTCFHVWHAGGRAKAWGGTRRGFVPRTNNVRPTVVIAPPGGGTVSSLSGSDNSSFDATDSTVAETIASLESGGAQGAAASWRAILDLPSEGK